MTELTLVLGDITKQRVDAIVNAANSSLLGGGGVDGAIHCAAGPELLAECRKLGRCPTGSARLTKAYRLPARFVIHAVGPIWQGGGHDEADLLASCYRQCLELALQAGCRSIAFPAISCGAYGYPLEEACHIALTSTTQVCREGHAMDEIRFVCFSRNIFEIYERRLRTLPPAP